MLTFVLLLVGTLAAVEWQESGRIPDSLARGSCDALHLDITTNCGKGKPGFLSQGIAMIWNPGLLPSN